MPLPTGMLSLPLNYLRNTIAGSAAFQAAVGVGTEALALPFVHAFEATGAQLDGTFYAVVSWGPDFGREIHAVGSNNLFNTVGALQLLFHQKLTDPAAIDAAYTFANLLGSIVSEMEQLSGTATYLDITAFRVDEGPYRPEEDEAATERGGDYYEILMSVEYRSQ